MTSLKGTNLDFSVSRKLLSQSVCKTFIALKTRSAMVEYSVLFKDNTYPEGYSPALDVAQRYVLPMRETKKK